jgi:hypothetical protein
MCVLMITDLGSDIAMPGFTAQRDPVCCSLFTKSPKRDSLGYNLHSQDPCVL